MKKSGKKDRRTRREKDIQEGGRGLKPTTPRPGFPVKVTQGEEEVPKEILADAIVKISDGFQRLKGSGLNRRAIVVLVKDASGVGMGDVNRILDAMEKLKDWYTLR